MKSLEKVTTTLQDYESLAEQTGKQDLVPFIMDFEAARKYVNDIDPEMTLNDLWVDFHKYHVIFSQLNGADHYAPFHMYLRFCDEYLKKPLLEGGD